MKIDLVSFLLGAGIALVGAWLGCKLAHSKMY